MHDLRTDLSFEGRHPSHLDGHPGRDRVQGVATVDVVSDCYVVDLHTRHFHDCPRGLESRIGAPAFSSSQPFKDPRDPVLR
jgi:hypothetical protein